ncbi:MAG: HTH domain-containing protein, partial [Pseudomonadota bacterium]|nr:HTH domain-containing protein [Pseudomonadota bacterium]
MDRTERFYTIDRLLQARRQVSLRQLMDELEVSRATVRR